MAISASLSITAEAFAEESARLDESMKEVEWKGRFALNIDTLDVWTNTLGITIDTLGFIMCETWGNVDTLGIVWTDTLGITNWADTVGNMRLDTLGIDFSIETALRRIDTHSIAADTLGIWVDTFGIILRDTLDNVDTPGII